MPVLSQFLEGLEKGKGMYFLFIKSEAKTPGGLLARPVLTSYYKSPHFKIRPTDPYTNYTSPIETVLCPDSFQSLYSQALCGLTHRTEVLRVGAVFASAFIRAVKFLENHWSSLSHDIRVGKPDPRVVTDPAVREAVMRVMQRPNSDLADLVEKECGKKEEPWKGIIKRLWPNTKYIEVVVTGTMAQYIPTLEYYGDGLPLVSPMYASSECYFGINLNPMCSPSEVAYTLLPNMAYFEFLPLENPHHINIAADHHRLHSHHLVDLVDVQLGKEYELVLTTYAGLYRYCVGDILRVAGFKNKAPQFNFIRRKNVALSIDSDKTDEVELHNAVTKATDHLLRCEYSIVEYTSYVDTSTIPGHYVLFWEISHDKTTGGGGGEGGSGDGDHHHHDLQLLPSSSVMEDCCLTIEESLNSVYRQCRASDKSIGPLEIRVVETGTFDMLMDHAVTTTGASINQYKTPRCVKYPPIIDLLNSRVLSKYFSPKCPKWLPGHKQWRST